MTEEGEQLLAVFERALGGALARTRARPATPPPPWLVWLVVVLCRQRERQRWLLTIHRRLTLDDAGDSGDVPDLPGWSFRYHGIGLLLEGPDHEQLDVDFHDPDAATIDSYFFAHRVEEMDPKPAPEARLAAWLPAHTLIIAGVDQLRAWGVLTPPPGGTCFQLCTWLEQRAVAIADDDFALVDGDGGDDGHAERDPRFLGWLETQLRDRDVARRIVRQVAARIGASSLPWCLALLDGPIDSATGAAVEALASLPSDADGVAGPRVAHLLDRLDPAEHHPFIAHAVASYLLARGLQRQRALDTAITFAEVEVVTGFRGNPYVDHLAMLVLEHDPHRGLPLVRRALRSSTPAVAGRMASLLAALDQPWSRRELVAALDEHAQTNISIRRELAARLARSHDADTRRIAHQLVPGPPQPAPGGVGYTFDEVVASSVHEDWYADDVAPIAARLRAVLPDVF
jgi:hypothetical protein